MSRVPKGMQYQLCFVYAVWFPCPFGRVYKILLANVEINLLGHYGNVPSSSPDFNFGVVVTSPPKNQLKRQMSARVLRNCYCTLRVELINKCILKELFCFW